MNKSAALFFQHGAGQSASGERAGIDINPVRKHFRFFHRRVPMHDDLPEIYPAIEKFVADPQQILLRLALKWNAGPDSRVAQEILADKKRCF